MTPPARIWLARTTAALMITGSLVACAGPSTTGPIPQPSLANPPNQPAASAARPISTGGGEQAARLQTCDLFRQMIVGIDILSTGEQQDLVQRMAEAVMASGDAELMYAVYDFGQGYLNSSPQQFAFGMRKLSAMCNVPYE